MIKAQLFDTVELLVDLTENNLHAGARGAIVEQYDDEHFEVEFINEIGETEQLSSKNNSPKLAQITP